MGVVGTTAAGRPGRSLRLAAGGLCCWLAATSAQSASLPNACAVDGAWGPLAQPVAVFGEDERARLPESLRRLEDKIGILYEERTRLVCTAYCVAPDIVATASHCIYRTKGERAPQLDGFTFRPASTARSEAARIAGAETKSAAQHVMSGSARLSVRPPIDASSDWALVKLASPVCHSGGLKISARPTSEIIGLAAAKRIYHVSYHRDFAAWRLAYDSNCDVRRHFGPADAASIERDFSAADRLLLHTCDTGGASSGSPLLFDGPGGPEVVGMNVGTYELSRVLMRKGVIVHRFKSDSVANTAVAAQALREALGAFTRSTLLSDSAHITSVQKTLAGLGFFTGRRDGRYGPELKGAIEAYERQSALPVTGLASSELLQRLSKERAPGAETASAKASVSQSSSSGQLRRSGTRGRAVKVR